jgi:hypothetical protein
MEPEATQPPSEGQPVEETQAEKQEAGTQELAKRIEPLHVEDHIDEFDLNTKFLQYCKNSELFREDLQREAAKSGLEPEDILYIGTGRELVIRRLLRPGRKISYRLIIDDEDGRHILTLLF